MTPPSSILSEQRCHCRANCIGWHGCRNVCNASLLTDDFLRAGTAVCPEAIYTDVLGFQKSEESLMGVCLMKTHIRVAIAVLDIDYGQ